MKQLTQREKRMLLGLAPALLAAGLWQLGIWSSQSESAPADGSIEAQEQRFALMREQVRRKPLSDAEYQVVEQALERIEGLLLNSATPALAQAEVRSLLGDLLKDEGIAMRNSRFETVSLEGKHYAQVPLTVDFTCAIEQFVNLMAAIANAPKLLTTRGLRLQRSNAQTKALSVRMTVSGYLPAERAPELVKRAEQPRVGL